MGTEQIAADHGDAVPADAGTVWVVGDVEVTRKATEDFFCGLDLVVAGHRTIAAAPPYVMRAEPTSCTADDVAVGASYRYLAIYRVPIRYAGEIYGLALRADVGARPVIRPPP